MLVSYCYYTHQRIGFHLSEYSFGPSFFVTRSHRTVSLFVRNLSGLFPWFRLNNLAGFGHVMNRSRALYAEKQLQLLGFLTRNQLSLTEPLMSSVSNRAQNLPDYHLEKA
ncbi:hypothetical protein Hanom_Chr10g00946881 [Helianthus anomalus]